ncbi:MAG: hypothetical protein VYA30_14415 [Myxococcota bacterium]|nr:hypothetical protein [Myxococcota bacterium]
MRNNTTALLIGMLSFLASAHGTPTKQIAVAPVEKDAGPILSFKNKQSSLEAGARGRSTFQTSDGFPVDKDGNVHSPEDSINHQFRIHADYKHTFGRYFWLEAHYEQDVYTGYSQALEQDPNLLPDRRFEKGQSEIRKANMSLRLGPIAIGGGINTSHWGLGLLANDGAHGWQHDNAYFTDPRSGDRVLRGYLLIGPLTDFKIAASIAYDSVIDDDILLEDDEAHQIIGALLLNPQGDRTAGIYVAHRTQENYTGEKTVITAIDAYGKWTQDIGNGLDFVAEMEAATIIGTTGLGASPEFEEHKVIQFGLASRVSLNGSKWGVVTDLAFASGDQNTDDEQINNFKADRNFEMGQLIFRTALTAISARAPITAANPELVGRPNADLDRIPTQGTVTNTLAIFPRVRWTPMGSLTLYGGPLFAFSSVPLLDPLNTKTGGGTPFNAYDAQAGRYLGTELNGGIRYTPEYAGVGFLLGLEIAYFTPGSAFEDVDGKRPDPISGGRAFVGVQL